MARWRTLHRRKARYVPYRVRQFERAVRRVIERLQDPELWRRHWEEVARQFYEAQRRMFATSDGGAWHPLIARHSSQEPAQPSEGDEWPDTIDG